MSDEIPKNIGDTAVSVQDAPEDELTLGQVFRTVREQMDLTLENVFQDTRIPVIHLEAIENDFFEDLPSEGTLRGFIVNYSKFLNLNHEDMIEMLSSGDTRQEELLPASFGSPQKRGLFQDLQGGKIIVGLAIFAFVVLVAAVAIWWFGTNQGERSNGSSGNANLQTEESQPTTVNSSEIDESNAIEIPELSSPQLPSTTQEFVADLPESEDSEILNESEDLPMEEDAEGLGSEEPVELFDDSSVDEPSAPSLATEETEGTITLDDVGSPILENDEVPDSEEAETAVVEEEGFDLEFRFNEISWVQVIDGEETVLVNGVQEAGSTLNLDGQAPFDIRLGKASGVKLLYRGEEVALAQYTRRDNTAEFTLQP